MTDRHECEWGPWHPWCAQYRCIYPGCYKNMPSDEVAHRLNAYSQREKERDSALRIARIVDLDERYEQTKALQDEIERGV